MTVMVALAGKQVEPTAAPTSPQQVQVKVNLVTLTLKTELFECHAVVSSN